MNVVAFDSNIPIYALLDQRSERKSAIATQLMLDATSQAECVISTQVLKEFSNVAIKKFSVDEAALVAYLHDLASLRVIDVNERIIALGVRRHFTSQISFYDALVVEAALSAGVEILYSEDLHHGMQFESLRVVNPFL